MKKHLFFDLDGTLLDTLLDIVKAINFSLKDIGVNYLYNYEEGKSLIGNGAKMMAIRALKPFKVGEEKKEIFYRSFLKKYQKYQCDDSKPFIGVLEGLRNLKKEGYHLYILSNKPDYLTKIIVKEKLDETLFDFISGKKDEILEKPAPDLFNYVIGKFNLKREEILYIGDSIVDIEFAKNSGVDVIVFTYGYGDYASKSMQNAVKLSEFSQLIEYLKNDR